MPAAPSPQTASPPTSARTRARTAVVLGITVALLGLIAMGGALRMLATWAAARWDGDYVLSADSDPYYHLRRLEYAARNGHTLVEDRFAASPAAFACPWPAAFEHVVLALDRLVFGAARDRGSLLVTAGVLPVLVGMLGILLAFVVLLPGASAGPALGGAAVVAVLPAAIGTTSFFAFDHHGLELCVCLLLPAAATWAVRLGPAAAGALGALTFGPAMLATDVTHALLLTTAASWLALAWVGRREGRVEARGLQGFAAGVLAAVALASALEVHLGWVRALSHQGRIGMAGGLLGASLVAGRSRAARIAGGAVLAAAGALAVPAALAGAAFLGGASNPITPHIAEVAPLWRSALHGRFVVYLLLVGLALLHVLRRRREVSSYPMLAAVAGCAALALVENKYAALLAVPLAWAVAQTLDWLASWRRLQAVAAALLVFGVGWRVADELRIEPSAVSPEDIAFARVARRLAARTAEQEVFAPGARPAWAVALEPSLGPRLLHLGRRAVTAMPFWGTPALARQFQRTCRVLVTPVEASAQQLLDELGARYVLVGDHAATFPALAAVAGLSPPMDQTLWYRLYHGDGTMGPQSPALERFRLLAEAGAPAPFGGFKVFERVAGARVAGRAAAGSAVALVLLLRSPEGREFPYLTETRADAAGYFRLTVPYATEPRQAAFAASARLLCPGASVPVQIGEQAVRSGAVLAVDCGTLSLPAGRHRP